MTRPARFTQADIRRAVAAVIATGLQVAKVEIEPTGKLVLFTGTTPDSPDANEWADLEP
jgi:hypothetical protein